MGKEFRQGKKLAFIENRNERVNVYPLYVLGALASWEATNGNVEAGKLLALGLIDSVRSLTLEQLGVEVNAELRNNWLKLRNQHKKQFHPLLTSWLKQDANGDSSKVEWGKEVNLFKLSARLPIKPVTDYNDDELTLMNTAEIRYDMCRKLGVSHQDALKVL